MLAAKTGSVSVEVDLLSKFHTIWTLMQTSRSQMRRRLRRNTGCACVPPAIEPNSSRGMPAPTFGFAILSRYGESRALQTHRESDPEICSDAHRVSIF